MYFIFCLWYCNVVIPVSGNFGTVYILVLAKEIIVGSAVLLRATLVVCTEWMDGWMVSFTPTSPLRGYAGYLNYNYPYVSIIHEPISYGRTLCLA